MQHSFNFSKISQKKHSGPVLADLGDSEKMKESGFIVPQEIPSHSWIKRGLDAAPNRYGIKPGRHWDGVDRSNGMFIPRYTLFAYFSPVVFYQERHRGWTWAPGYRVSSQFDMVITVLVADQMRFFFLGALKNSNI